MSLALTSVFAALFGLGMPELLVLLLVLLLLFGGAKLPGLARGLGQSIKEFKNASKDDPAPEKKPDPANDPSKLRNN